MPVEEYEDRVRKAIEKAIRTAGDGRSASAFAKRMRAEVGNGPGLSAPARWIRSDEGHERIPAWALLAAADVAQVSVAELLEDGESPGVRAELNQLKAEFATLRRSASGQDQMVGTSPAEGDASEAAQDGEVSTSALARAVTEQSRQLAGMVKELEQQGRMLAHLRSALSEQGIQLAEQAGGREADAL